jgi:hypothetical protein
MAQDKGRTKSGKSPETAPEKVSVSVVWEGELLKLVDARAKELDLNRSQYLRRLAKRDLAEKPLAKAA